MRCQEGSSKDSTECEQMPEDISLLILWSTSITAQLTNKSMPFNTVERNYVILHLHNLPAGPLIYIWHKGKHLDNNNKIVSLSITSQSNIPGPIHSSRKTIYPNGSLLFQNSVTKPSIQASNTAVTEHEGPVTLTCLTNHTGISIHWVFQGQILRLAERMMLSQDNSSLTTDPIRRQDAGEYHCEVSNPVSSSKSDLLILTMNRDDSVPESSGLLVGAIASIVVGVLARVALIRNTAGYR
ncbi:LOW QUALITY PROTEIN: carcinoembryonic antigen-related cell adhesion molecule 1-like [Elephas maximus indicus]|uniref:LOW QUALITY PROTEIN: carcinoembryonic antigen-related cell adhesion molecule 1-like n=1 Tax=Elephas maximus indicus TaxID=99487 RepID=UPI0021166028|nr:LOW QUALITY PROTEIN: carcinoembryonic antigen-related cell adhesion molecule 1-like [Elephas maximus indicus]